MSLTFDDILGAAREQSAAPDPASDTWREGLQILLRDHERERSLSERGEGIIRKRYVDALAARMQVDDHIRHNPAVTGDPIKRPVFILGMPRTGTTMVSYLMNADPPTGRCFVGKPIRAARRPRPAR